jgi:two-component system, OmpR family, sensor histidine kinase BaeS
MRLGITTKLFLGVLATSVLVALVMAATGRVKFQRDFQQYVEMGENRRIEALAETLAAIYQETGDWSALEGGPALWLALLRSTPRLPDAGRELYGGPMPGWPHVALYDTDDHPIMGFVGASGDTARHPIVVDGRVVGRIARSRWVGPTEVMDVTFQQAQLRNFLVATFAAILLAALAAALLSRTFLAPARAVGNATHRLAAGDFKARVQVRSTDEFGRLADDFNLLALTLERNEEMRRRMMADVAHELRTPLAIIQGELAALEDGIRQVNPETICSLQSEARALGKLIDDLYQLSLSDLGALDYRRRDLDLRARLAEVLLLLRDRCAENGPRARRFGGTRRTLDGACRFGPPGAAGQQPRGERDALHGRARAHPAQMPQGCRAGRARDFRFRAGHPRGTPAAHVRTFLQTGPLAQPRFRGRRARARDLPQHRRSARRHD